MSLVNQRIAPLTGGVSQRPPELRSPSQAEIIENAVLHPTWGVIKRPPKEEVAVLVEDASSIVGELEEAIPADSYSDSFTDNDGTALDEHDPDSLNDFTWTHVDNGQPKTNIVDGNLSAIIPPVLTDPVFDTPFEDTFTDTTGTAIGSHTPDTGSAWGTNANLEVHGNELCPNVYTAQEVLNTTSLVFDDKAEFYADVEVDADFGVNSLDERIFYFAAKALNDERYYISFQTSGDVGGRRSCVFAYGHYDSSGTSHQHSLSSAFSLAVASSNPPLNAFGGKTLYRIGFTINTATDIDIWTEPGGGGTRTNRVIGWNPQAGFGSPNFFDGTHDKIGVKFVGTTDGSGTGFASWSGYENAYRRLKISKMAFTNFVSAADEEIDPSLTSITAANVDSFDPDLSLYVAEAEIEVTGTGLTNIGNGIFLLQDVVTLNGYRLNATVNDSGQLALSLYVVDAGVSSLLEEDTGLTMLTPGTYTMRLTKVQGGSVVGKLGSHTVTFPDESYPDPRFAALETNATTDFVITAFNAGAETAVESNAPLGFHAIKRSVSERYKVIVANGDLKVFNAITGVEVAVSFPDGKGYLNARGPWRFVTDGDRTYIVDTSKTVLSGSDTAPNVQANEAFVWVSQADFSTSYNITLNGISTVYLTPAGASAAARGTIATDVIATALKEAIDNQPSLDAFVVTRFGSTLHITRTDGVDFLLSTSDGLADEGFGVAKLKVRRFEDLPPRAPNGSILQVAGDPSLDTDDYWVKYDDQGTPEQNGVWVETASPGILRSFDASTMPHELVRTQSELDGVQSSGGPGSPDVFDAIEDYTAHSVYEMSGNSPGSSISNSDDATLSVPLIGTSSVGSVIPTGATTVKIRAGIQFVGSSFKRLRLTIQQNAGVDSTSYSTLTSADYTTTDFGFGNLVEVEITATLSGPGNRIRVVPSIVTGNSNVLAALYSKNETNPGPGVSFSVSTDKYVNFGADRIYPEGTTVTVVVGASTVTLGPLSEDTEGSSVATSIAASVDALALYTASVTSAGIVKIHKTDNATPSVTATTDFDPDTTFHNTDLDLTPDALIGRTIRNLSDGSEGVITDNGVTTIAVASLAGGANNSFATGDLCSVNATTGSFAFREVEWDSRDAGNEESNPFPGFVGTKIRELFLHRGRLGFCYKNAVALSEAGAPTNFFRNTVRQVLDGDPIDASSTEVQADFHSAVLWNGQLVLWTDQHQVLLEGEPLLTSKSIRLRKLTEYPNSPHRPIQVGHFLYFMLGAGSYTQVYAWGLPSDAQADRPQAFSLTADVPRYLSGAPAQVVAWNDTGMLFALTDDGGAVFVRGATQDEEGNEVAAGWNTWTFADDVTVLNLDVIDGVVYAVLLRDVEPTVLYLEKFDLSIVPTDATAVDYEDSGDAPFTFRVKLSPIFPRRASGNTSIPVTDQRMQMRSIELDLQRTQSISVSVIPQGRDARTKSFVSADPVSGRLHVPVLSRADTVGIYITDSSVGQLQITGLDWQGFLSGRRRNTITPSGGLII